MDTLRASRRRLKERRDRHRRKNDSPKRTCRVCFRRESDDFENGDGRFHGAEEPHHHLDTGVKQEDLDDFREQLDNYATFLANLSTLCRFLVSRAPSPIILEAEELCRLSPKLLPFVRNGPHTAILPQDNLPHSLMDFKRSDRAPRWLGPRESTAQSSPGSELHPAQRSPSAPSQPQHTGQPSAQNHVPQAPEVAAPPVWTAPAGWADSGPRSQELTGHHPPGQGPGSQLSMQGVNVPGGISNGQHGPLTQRAVASQGPSSSALCTQQSGPTSTLAQQFPYAIGQNAAPDMQPGSLVQTSVGPTNANPDNRAQITSAPAVVQIPHVGYGNSGLLAATHQAGQTIPAQSTSGHPAQVLLQLPGSASSQTGQLINQGWTVQGQSQQSTQTTQAQPPSVPTAGSVYPNVFQSHQPWQSNPALHSSMTAQAAPSTQQGHPGQPAQRTQAAVPVLDHGTAFNGGGGTAIATTGQPAAGLAANQWVTAADINLMAEHQDSYMSMFTNPLE